mmetsp:Transcript_23568/g.68941  ORF Transcript_23568/g.68941 Transcript_23568/m.68941 type:complete len:222 (-) Transcript_23568:1057-1722(-)
MSSSSAGLSARQRYARSGRSTSPAPAASRQIRFTSATIARKLSSLSWLLSRFHQREISRAIASLLFRATVTRPWRKALARTDSYVLGVRPNSWKKVKIMLACANPSGLHLLDLAKFPPKSWNSRQATPTFRDSSRDVAIAAAMSCSVCGSTDSSSGATTTSSGFSSTLAPASNPAPTGAKNSIMVWPSRMVCSQFMPAWPSAQTMMFHLSIHRFSTVPGSP